MLILGDTRFHLPWASADNAIDRERFRELCELTRVDTIDVFGKPSIHHDLHEPVPNELRNQFDMVVDDGTLFCCFDVATVLKNCFDMLKDKGVILHQAALTGYYGRCYYNIHPAFFKDVYEQNNFTILAMEVRVFKELSWRAKVQRMLRDWRGLPVGRFKPIGHSATFLRHADFVDMEFTEEPAVAAPMLPNDALVLCVARRSERQQFVRPLPTYYAKTSRDAGQGVRPPA